MPTKNWSHEELIVAFNLYCKTPFGRIHIRNPEIIALAKILNRTPSSVSWKLANFARLDPSLKKRNISGATHGAKGEIEVWNEFNSNWEALGFESEKLLAQMSGKTLTEAVQLEDMDVQREGKEREAIVRVRVNQNFFRSAVFAAYEARCCITGLEVPELLNASHIVPWSIDIKNRVNPRNGLCLNAIHDRAFDRGLITVTPDYKVRISSRLMSKLQDDSIGQFIRNCDGASIKLPERFLPDVVLLKYHNEHVFMA